MLVVGLTGGIGSGKSTVADLFASYGVPIIDTDQLAREVVMPGLPAWQAITAHFGKDIVLPSQQLDRAALRKLVFNNPQQRGWLEQLLHPLIREKMQESIQKLAVPYCIVVIPLLAESKPNPAIQRVLVVDTAEHLQISRTLARDNSSQAEIQAIIERQAKRHERLAIADDVIINDHDLAHLQAEVAKLHQIYLQLGRQ
jgi:dephospho-CoA kinase